MEYQLSYIISTRNRLTFLKITLAKLISELLPDEEIVVVDGNSNDGAKEYLQQLFTEGKIHQYISEPDHNQAHGWNKAMLMARGTIIKKIIDDDVFCYQAIRKCKDYMQQHRDVDVVISNDLYSSVTCHTTIDSASRFEPYKQWQAKIIPSFTFGDVHLLIRRSSLAYIGLYNTCYTMMDYEYSLRMSYLQAKIVYYTGYNALSVAHAQTVTSASTLQVLKKEGESVNVFYEYAGDHADVSRWSKIKVQIGLFLFGRKAAESVLGKKEAHNLNLVYEHFYSHLESLNEDNEFEFIA
jgi:glycosyltransferase involved in cell wall biosynthesis